MKAPRHRRAKTTVAITLATTATLLLLNPLAHAEQKTAIWNAGSGNYSTPGNWDIAETPLNNTTDTFTVQIPGNPTVTYQNLNGVIDSLILGDTATLNLNDDNLGVDTSLTVLGATQISGNINATNASSFTATGAGTEFLGNTIRLSTTNGGNIEIGATGYSSTGLFFGGEIFSSAGSGSMLDLSTLEEINAGFDDGSNTARVQQVNATGGGVIDLSGVTAITKPARPEDRVDINVNSTGHLDLSSLATVSGAGRMIVTVDGGILDLGPLATMDRSTFSVSGGGSVSTVGTGITGGGYTTTSFTGGGVMLSSTGAGSILDLSSLSSINAGFNDGSGTIRAQQVNATAGGVIDLSGVTTLTAPARADDRIDFNVNSGGDVNLSALQTIIGPESGRGQTRFTVNDGTVTLGPIERMDRSFFNLAAGATVTAGGFAGAAEVTDSTFVVQEGSVLNASALAGTYSSLGFPGGGVIMSSSGADSVLDLSSLSSINAGFDDGSNTARVQQVNATSEGVIDLSDVTAIMTPARSEDRVDINVNSGGRVDLTSLTTITGAGQVLMTVDGASGGATVDLGSLATAHRTFVSLTNGAMVRDGGGMPSSEPGLISDSTFSVSGGSQFVGATIATSYSSTGLTGGGVIFSSTGAGSLLDLSSLSSINAGFNDGSTTPRVQQINATGGGVIDLSGVTAITKPARPEDRVDINVNSTGHLDLSSLATVSGAGRMIVTVDGGILDLGPLATMDRSTFSVSGGGSVSTVGTGITGGGYTTTSFTGGGVMLSSTGAGSILDLSSLSSINAGFNDGSGTIRAQQVNATAGGVIDLSGVTTLTAPARADDRIDFNVNSGGDVNLSALQTIIGPESGRGQTRFTVNDGTVTLGPIERMDRSFFNLAAGATVTAGGFAGAAEVTDSTFVVQEGSVLNASALAGTYSSLGFPGGGVIMSSSGADSVLDLSSLSSINAGFDDGSNTARVQQVNATSEGVIDLSDVTAIMTPARSEDRVDINVNSGGRVDLTSLTTITGAGQVLMTVDGASGGATVDLGSLATAHRTFVSLTNGAMVRDGGGMPSSEPGLISDSTFSVSGGSQFVGATIATSYSSTGLTGGGVIFSSTGAGSLLDLSSLSSINAGFNDGSTTPRVQQINATGGGVIDLSGVTAITKPARPEDRVDINVNSTGHLDLSSLATVSGAGRMIVTVDGGILDLGPLATMDRSTFSVSGGGSVSTVGTGITGGGYTTTSFTGGGVMLSSTGAGSILDLSSLSSINAGFNDGSGTIRAQQVNATAGGVIDLSGVTTLTAPARADDRIDFNVNSGGHLGLGSLNAVNGAGQIRFTISGGQLTMGPLTTADRVTIDLDSTSIMDAPGDLTLGSGVTLQMDLSPTDRASIDVTGTVTLETALNLELVDNLIPEYGNTFDILTYGDRSGVFTQVTGHFLSPVLALGQFYDDANGVLQLLATAPGDANGDLIVNISDFGLLAGNFNQPGSWEQGDFNGDGVTNITDFGLLAANFNGDFNTLMAAAAELGITTIPEPATATLLGVVVCGLAAKRRRV